jgi:hypothetical protein
MSLTRDEAQARQGSTPALYFQIFKEDKHGRLTKMLINELSTLTLTYFNYSTSATINSRSNQNVLNTNNVTVSDTGEVKWSLQTADTTVVDTTLDDGKLERHEALFKWTTTDSVASSARISIWIIRDAKV